MFQRRRRNPLLAISLPAAALILLGFALGLGNSGSAVSASTPVVTYSRDVAPTFFNKCAGCHRPGEAAPMSLLTYKDARPWARSIKEKVLNRSMPPWHADPTYGKFENDRSLSKKDIDTIIAWVDGGAPEGDPRELPLAPRFTEGWRIGKPDVVLTMPVKFDVPAQGVLDYKYFPVPTHFTEDRWVQAAEVRPGNPSVVHHVIIFVEHPRGQSGRSQADDRTDDRDAGLESLTGVAPGEEPVILPDGVGMLIRAGSVLLFQMHYTPNGVAQSDQTSVGLIFNKKPVTKASMGGAAMNTTFAIPAGEPNYEVQASYAIDDDCHITNLMPHMHVRGKDFQFLLAYPDGSSRIILSVPRYDFNWQTRYQFAEPIAAPKGSRIDCIAHFDNSPENRSNPNPAKLVRWGDQTFDEMMIGFIEFTLDHQQPQDLLPKPSGQGRSNQGTQQPALAKAAETRQIAAPPPIDQILDKYVQAIGGKAAIQARTSCVMKGTVTVPAFGANGTILIYAKAPNKELTEITSGFLGNSRTGFDGTSAWEEENGEVKDLPNYRKAGADFYLPIKLRQVYPRIELMGKEKIGNREAYLLEAPRRGNPKRWYFDTETGLLIRTEEISAEGRLLEWEEYDDYRAVDGVQVPFTNRGREENGVEFVVKLSEVKHNIAIDDAKFEKPKSSPVSKSPL